MRILIGLIGRKPCYSISPEFISFLQGFSGCVFKLLLIGAISSLRIYDYSRARISVSWPAEQQASVTVRNVRICGMERVVGPAFTVASAV